MQVGHRLADDVVGADETALSAQPRDHRRRQPTTGRYEGQGEVVGQVRQRRYVRPRDEQDVPLKTGRVSKNATMSSLSRTISAATEPAAMAQKRQSLMGAILLDPDHTVSAVSLEP